MERLKLRYNDCRNALKTLKIILNEKYSIIVQDATIPGIARGPHEHREQADIFAFIGPGNFRIHLWDNRGDSPTNKIRMIIFGGEDNPLLVVVPPGVVHGYKNESRTVRGMVFIKILSCEKI